MSDGVELEKLDKKRDSIYTQVIATEKKGALESMHSSVSDEDEEAIEAGLVSITGYTPDGHRILLFWLGFFGLMGALGYIAWLWPGGLFYEDSGNCQSHMGVPTGGCLSYHVGFFFAVFVIFAGCEILWFRWYPGHYVKLRSVKHPLDIADSIVVECTDGSSNPCEIQQEMHPSGKYVRYFNFRHCKLVWNADKQKFIVSQPDMGAPVLKSPLGYEEEVASRMLQWNGPNLIDVPLPSWLVLLASEILHPFLWFQLFSIVVWCMEDYYLYSMVIAFLTVVSAVISLVETRSNLVSIRSMSRFISEVTVYRNGEAKRLPSTEVAPGDVVVIESETQLPFDAVLLSGEAIINESMLTGESVPVVKVAFSHMNAAEMKAQDVPRASVLFNGTLCLQAKPNPFSEYPTLVLAKVWKTGFATTKGRLVRSILFPQPSRFSLYRDGFRFVGIMCGTAVISFVISTVYYVRRGVPPAQIVLYGLDLVTTVVPPALPTTLLTGMTLAIARLQKSKMFCISPPRINVAGKVGLLCFDKTGTLTEEGLDLQKIIPVHEAKFLTEIDAKSVESVNKEGGEGRAELLSICGTCHALRFITKRSAEIESSEVEVEKVKEGRDLIGDPLEVKMFEATTWTLLEPKEIKDDGKGEVSEFAAVPPSGSHESLHEQRVVKTYEFSSSLQRMGVICRDVKTRALTVMIKGAPEVIARLSDPASLPDTLTDVLKTYTKAGFRVIAAASRQIDSESNYREMTQEEAEGKEALTFRGLIVLENKLKPQSEPTIKILHEAAIGTVMITGDHALTAINVARKLGIIPSSKGWVFIADTNDQGEVVWINEETDEKLNDEQIRGAGLLKPKEESPLRVIHVKFLDESWRNQSKVALVLTGRAFDVLCRAATHSAEDEAHLRYLLEKTVVAARFSPSQKQRLVDLLGETGHITGFCGDGANDCSALKSADVGLSLSPQAEASVAAPFTSQITDISSVVTLLREGRCALSTSFLLFKFMALYAFIQTLYNLQTYILGCYLGDYMYLFNDLILVLPLAATMGNTMPWPFLDKKRPTSSLISFGVMASIFGQIFWNCIFQVIAREYMRARPFFQPQGFQQTGDENDDEVAYLPGYEPTAIWVISNFQFLWMAFIFTISKPFRQPFYTNIPYTITVALSMFFCTYILCNDNVGWVNDLFALIPLEDQNVRGLLFTIAMSSLVASWLHEQLIYYSKEYYVRKRQNEITDQVQAQERHYEEHLGMKIHEDFEIRVKNGATNGTATEPSSGSSIVDSFLPTSKPRAVDSTPLLGSQRNGTKYVLSQPVE